MQVPITLMILNKGSKLYSSIMPSDWGCKAVWSWYYGFQATSILPETREAQSSGLGRSEAQRARQIW